MAGNDSYTKLLLHMDRADGSTTFTDSSLASQGTATTFGTVQVDTAQSVFGGASLLGDGDSDYLTFPDSNDWFFDVLDFTIDFWVRFNSVASDITFYSQKVDGNNYFIFKYQSAGALGGFETVGGVDKIFDTRSWSPSTNTWYHIAYVRSGGNTFRIFVDGTQLGTDITNSEAITNFATGIAIGSQTGPQGINGWIDEFRISKGIARWTTNFTPPTSAYSVDSTATNSSRMLMGMGQ